MKYIFIILTFITTLCFSQNKIKYKTFTLKGTGEILIPSSLEKQDDVYKKLSEKAQKEIGEEVTDDRVVFHRKGRNANSENKSPSYEKIIFETHIGNIGDFKKYNSKATKEELKQINDDSKNTFKSEMEIYKTKINIKLLSWTNASNVIISNKNVIKLSYTRQINENEPSIADVYFFVNNDRYHKITICYRVSQSSEWKPVFEKVINSFIITNIK